MLIFRFLRLVRYEDIRVMDVPIEPKIESASVIFSRVNNGSNIIKSPFVNMATEQPVRTL